MKKGRLWRLFLTSFITLQVNLAALAADDAQEFVRKIYTHGLPYAKAKELGRDAVQPLLKMLKDPQEKISRANIVLVLGIVGDESAVEPLISFLETDFKGEVDPYTVQALVSVPTALGHIAGQGSKKALNYLLDHSTLEVWQQKQLPWTHGGKPGTAVFATGLHSGVLVGLGIAAQPASIAKLKSIKGDARLHSHIRGEADEAIELADDIVREGRTKVLSRPRNPPRMKK